MAPLTRFLDKEKRGGENSARFLPPINKWNWREIRDAAQVEKYERHNKLFPRGKRSVAVCRHGEGEGGDFTTCSLWSGRRDYHTLVISSIVHPCSSLVGIRTDSTGTRVTRICGSKSAEMGGFEFYARGTEGRNWEVEWK